MKNYMEIIEITKDKNDNSIQSFELLFAGKKIKISQKQKHDNWITIEKSDCNNICVLIESNSKICIR